MKKAYFQLRVDRVDTNVFIVLFLVFLAHWLLSGNNSYWLDELVSVSNYGIAANTANELVTGLARKSVHPPLYQIILYYWMKVFGHTEVATRFLSNIYVTSAAFCIYLTARGAIGKRRAFIGTIIFTLMYVPFYYAIETRSYAQSLFLNTLSSLALFRYMSLLSARTVWKQLLLGHWPFVFLAANFCLLMTHYYNLFSLVAQGGFFVAWSLYRSWRANRNKPIRLIGEPVKAALLSILPIVLFFVFWGRLLFRSYRRHRKGYAVSGDVDNPFVVVWRKAIEVNFPDIPSIILGLLGGLLVLFYVIHLIACIRGGRTRRTGKITFTTYILFMAFGPFVIAYVVFLFSGHERYSTRYFSYTAPYLAFMPVIAIEQGIWLFDCVIRRRWFSRIYIKSSLIFTIIITALVLPGTFEAATKRKSDWRGIARLISHIVASDPTHEYGVYSTGFTKNPSLNYYFKRLGTDIKVKGLLSNNREKRHRRPITKRGLKRMRKHDYIIVTFAHLKTKRFRRTIDQLNSHFTIHQNLIRDGNGIIIFKEKE